MGKSAGHFRSNRDCERKSVSRLCFSRTLVADVSGGAKPLLCGGREASSFVLQKIRCVGKVISALGRNLDSKTIAFSRRCRAGCRVEDVRIPIPHSTEAGFALVSFVALFPLIMALVITSMSAYAMFRKKLTAQSLCVSSVTRLQKELNRDLDAILKLNPKAQVLRKARAKADAALKKAILSGNPPAIAAAKAARAAVILQQVAHRTRQEAVLIRAGANRMGAQRSLKLEVSKLGVSSVAGTVSYNRPLAVEPRPASSMTPDYIEVANFPDKQQHEFSFQLDLAPDFLKLKFRQETSCSATLKKQEGKWRESLIAASRRSKPQ